MIYDKELVQHKNRSFGKSQGLQIFRSKDNAVERMLVNSRVCSNSIHGVEYLWDSKSRPAIRLFWLLVVVAAAVSCVVMYEILTERHHEQILNTVVETSQLPIYTIHFPAVAVCPWNHVKWFRYRAAERRFLSPNADNRSKELFFALLSVMEGVTFTRLDNVKTIVNTTFPSSIKNIALHELAQFLAFRCDELFVSCVFDETVYDCCKIFVAERTERGICMVFNSLISEESRMKKLTDAYYPWKIRTSGEGSGLTFTMRHNANFQKPESEIKFSFSILIKEPEEWSDPLYHFGLPNTHNYLSITPIITETASNTRSMDPQKRRCLFADESSKQYGRIEGLPFNKLNCLVHCQQRFVITHCNCTLSMFFPEKPGQRECKVADLPCLYRHRDVFNYMKSPLQDEYIKDSRRGMECDCIDNCRSLIFLVSPNSSPIPNHNNSLPEVKADIYINRNVMTKYGARLDYTSMDLLANFGGVLGLCLGASVLSIFEMFYFIVKILFIWLLEKRNSARRNRKVHFVEHPTSGINSK